MTGERLFRTDLFNGEIPRLIRCYDTGDGCQRFAVLFNGQYRKRTDGMHVALRMSADPFAAGESGLAQSSTPLPLDQTGGTPLARQRSRAKLGQALPFTDLPPACRRIVVSFYGDLWGTLPPPLPKPPAGLTLRPDQLAAIDRWIAARAAVNGFATFYRLGESYILRDLPTPRSYGSVNERQCQAYVQVDHATARMVDALASRSETEVRRFLVSEKDAR